MGNGALAIGPKQPRPSSTLPARKCMRAGLTSGYWDKADEICSDRVLLLMVHRRGQPIERGPLRSPKQNSLGRISRSAVPQRYLVGTRLTKRDDHEQTPLTAPNRRSQTLLGGWLLSYTPHRHCTHASRDSGALSRNWMPEVPRAFERCFQAPLPLLRVGRGLIRPRGQVSASVHEFLLVPDASSALAMHRRFRSATDRNGLQRIISTCTAPGHQDQREPSPGLTLPRNSQYT
jgi:hypothetical protein